jgi:hypothetical protein
MAKWIVTVVETVTKYVEVEADNREDAIDCAEQASDEDFYGHSFDPPEATDAEEIS